MTHMRMFFFFALAAVFLFVPKPSHATTFPNEFESTQYDAPHSTSETTNTNEKSVPVLRDPFLLENSSGNGGNSLEGGFSDSGGTIYGRNGTINSEETVDASNSLRDPPTSDDLNEATETLCLDILIMASSEPLVSQASPIEQKPVVAESIPSGAIEINEVYPRPASDESEWVEITNTWTSSIVINGWNLVDASGAVTPFPDGTLVPGATLVIENPKGKLNNDGDILTIKNAQGVVVDSIGYNEELKNIPEIGESLVRTNTTLTISITPTKNTANILAPRPTKPPAPEKIALTKPTETKPVASKSELSSTALTSPIIPNQLSIIKTLRLSELYPNTGGKDTTDEFVELHNFGEEKILLENWIIEDASGAKFTFSKTESINPKTFLAVFRPQSHLTLNNDTDTIKLLAPDGSVVDTQSYEKTAPSHAFADVAGLWVWSGNPSPNESNPVPSNLLDTQTKSVSSKTSKQNAPALAMTIAEAKNAKNGARVTVNGFVSVIPNVFNTQTMYIQDQTGGIQIYKSDCAFPSLTEGQAVKITGVISRINGETRVKVSNTLSIAPGSDTQQITANIVAYEDAKDAVGSLISIAGSVVTRSSSRAVMNVDGESWNVDFPKASPIQTAAFQTGTEMQVRGILTKTKTGLALKPRSDADVTVVPASTISPPHAPDVLASIGEKQTTAIILMILTSIVLLGLKLRPRLLKII